jgi:acetylornithine deacetylase/succinyl-diaminopimelate desuccinylase-like protein
VLNFLRHRNFWLWAVSVGLIIGIVGLFWFENGCREGGVTRARWTLNEAFLKDDLGAGVVEAMKAVSSERLKVTIADLQGFGERSSWEMQALTCQYVLKRLRAMGLDPEVQEYHYEDRAFSNIVVQLPGLTQSDKRLLAIAHYDSKNWIRGLSCPGADDDGTGVGVLLEIAQLMRTFERQRTWQLVFSSNEERGEQGSRDYARRARQDGIDLTGVVSVDIVGYRPPGLSELVRISRSPLNVERKIKGFAKVIYNGYLARANGCAQLKLAFRNEDRALAPPATLRAALGSQLFWQLGGACA